MKRAFFSLVLSLGLSLTSSGLAFSQDLQKHTFSCIGETVTLTGTMLLEEEFFNLNGYAKLSITEPGKSLKVVVGVAQQGMWTTERLTIHVVQEMSGNYVLTFIADDYFLTESRQSFTAQLIGDGFETLACVRN